MRAFFLICDKEVWTIARIGSRQKEHPHGHPLIHGLFRRGGQLHDGAGFAVVPALCPCCRCTADMKANYFLGNGRCR